MGATMQELLNLPISAFEDPAWKDKMAEPLNRLGLMRTKWI